MSKPSSFCLARMRMISRSSALRSSSECGFSARIWSRDLGRKKLPMWSARYAFLVKVVAMAGRSGRKRMAPRTAANLGPGLRRRRRSRGTGTCSRPPGLHGSTRWPSVRTRRPREDELEGELGRRKSAGRCTAAARARVKSRLVTGCGAVALSRAGEAVDRQQVDPTWSSRWIHEFHCSPLATGRRGRCERAAAAWPAPRRRGQARTRPDDRHAHAERACMRSLSFPCHADARREIIARRARFGERRGAAHAIVPIADALT